jgi:hypothetical protein
MWTSCPSIRDLVSATNHLADFHEISHKSFLQNVVEQDDFYEKLAQ